MTFMTFKKYYDIKINFNNFVLTACNEGICTTRTEQLTGNDIVVHIHTVQ